MRQYKELLLGCGTRMCKDIYLKGHENFVNVTTVDNNPDCHPDILYNLTDHPLPFHDEEFDEIHAYDVLEHLAHQGDYKFFFSEFSEYWRILKPGGHFFASVPKVESVWAWGDPSHKRVITRENLTYLNQKMYEQCGRTKMSDFRGIYQANFVVSSEVRPGQDIYCFILQKLPRCSDADL